MTLLEKIINEFQYEPSFAKLLINSGSVLVNEEKMIVASYKLKSTDIVRVIEKEKYVSRGAYKLLKAIEKFNINAKDKVALDIGSSTGGFTQVLLENEVKKIYALDVGKNQLDYKLRINPQVISLEKTNLKSITNEMFVEKIDIIVCDVSFISIKNVFNVIFDNDILQDENDIIILIKPQFEANKKLVQKGGYVDKQHHNMIIDELISYAKSKNLKFIDIIESPIQGKKSKNVEYLSWFKYEGL